MLSTYEDYVEALRDEAVIFGENEDRETVVLQMYGEAVMMTTIQDNGWTRTNYLWPDGTVEETYSK